jgi:hypothetical protein
MYLKAKLSYVKQECPHEDLAESSAYQPHHLWAITHLLVQSYWRVLNLTRFTTRRSPKTHFERGSDSMRTRMGNPGWLVQTRRDPSHSPPLSIILYVWFNIRAVNLTSLERLETGSRIISGR